VMLEKGVHGGPPRCSDGGKLTPSTPCMDSLRSWRSRDIKGAALG
jgi:hypothetical protein